MLEYNEVFENNKKWIEAKKQIDAKFFDHLAEGQKPNFLIIGCSDSRVVGEELIGAAPGEVFVHRNIANLVPNNDISSEAVLKYAVDHLEVKHIVVCGHYLCGGVLAAMEGNDQGILNLWLRNIHDVYRLHQQELENISNKEERNKRLVELNVQEQCLNIAKKSFYQKHYNEKGFPEIHGWVFDIESGGLIDLNIDVSEELKPIQKIYKFGVEA